MKPIPDDLRARLANLEIAADALAWSLYRIDCDEQAKALFTVADLMRDLNPPQETPRQEQPQQ